MNEPVHMVRKIDGKGRSIRELLSGCKYSIDYYQREYKWEKDNIAELLNDLNSRFAEDHDEGNQRKDVAKYGHYFLGSIIISDRDGQKYIIDGQQRLTTITLLLVYLFHKLARAGHTDQKGQITEMIFSQKYGMLSFNLDIPERNACMEALYKGEEYMNAVDSESIQNILSRYQDIGDLFPEELDDKALPYFTDWLIENVHMVEITAYCDVDAYMIFETMNDRGLSLSATDMLKGYLLSKIKDPQARSKAGDTWKNCVQNLSKLGKEGAPDGIKAWLRSQYAATIRERKRHAEAQDFDLIGTEFHRWVRDHETDLGLNNDVDFDRFIHRDFHFYARWYQILRQAAETFTNEYPAVFYNAQLNFTLQYSLLLAPLRLEDPEEVIARKIRITSTFLDILIHRRIWNLKATDYTSMQYAMFLVIKSIRGLSVEKLVEALRSRLDSDTVDFCANDRFRMHGMNRRQIHLILARMTDYVETQSGQASHFSEYIQGGRKGFEVEHIWANKPDDHRDDFQHPSEFDEYRNHIGGLLLLPKRCNASYGSMPYAEKIEHYIKQNLLASSLHPLAYQNNPGFKQFIGQSGLGFHACPDFRKADLDRRQALYLKLAERIWDPQRLQQELDA